MGSSESIRSITLLAFYAGSPIYLAGACGQLLFLRRHRTISTWPWVTGCIVLTVAVSLALTVMLWVVPLGFVMPMWVGGGINLPALLTTGVVAPVVALLFSRLSHESRHAA